MADELAPIEVVDAYATVAWAAAALGRIPEVEAITGEGLAHVSAGQAPTYVLHLLTWRTYALTVLGRWDEASEAGDRAHELWVAIGRGPARFAGRGFLAAHDVAVARQDHQRMARLRATIEEIWSDDPELSEWQGYMDGDPGQMHRYLSGPRDSKLPTTAQIELTLWRPEIVERMLSRCCDLQALPSTATLEAIDRSSQTGNLAMVSLQARRAMALRARDAGELDAVLEACDGDRLQAVGARVRCELGELRGDETLLAAGLAALDRLGDVDQRDRVVARHAGKL
jgi:hypothetical protein